MGFLELVALGSKIIQMTSQFKQNYDQVKASLSSSEQAELDQILENIHQENMKLSSDIDDAVAEAEKRT